MKGSIRKNKDQITVLRLVRDDKKIPMKFIDKINYSGIANIIIKLKKDGYLYDSLSKIQLSEKGKAILKKTK